MSFAGRISMVTLGVTDLARSTAFYQALGWPLSARSQDGISFFRTAGALLALFPSAELAADALQPAHEPAGFRNVTCAVNLATEAAVDEALATAVAAGATLLKPAQKVEWGGYSGYFADPDGHAWEVAYNPFWPLNDAGLPELP
ncbi:VOC family protein [Catellatospora sichuanensis]|uniref:VOC family protein n=1 Tax=Catellatospora sichuanensis TaxID=1969805 RepID=UPI001183148F|nr:VOC family protein [Catellatospora sichuanensis]